MTVYRGFFVWGIGIVVVLLPFLGFVLAGWPGDADKCVNDKPDTCYCEQFDIRDVRAHASGVRQPVNTWFNLYAIFTSGLLALVVFFDRKGGESSNPMRSTSLIPDMYIFAVLFLGLGSMWFHASLTQWGGIFDGLSMYIYAAFLVFYTAYRMWRSEIFFWLGYSGTVLLFTIVHGLWDWEYKSLVLIVILVLAYLVLEFTIWGRTGQAMQGKPLTIALWLLAVLAIGLAALFWALSQTGRPMCDPSSRFQPHGMLWHPLAGVMAVLLYFYWREEQSA